jgi:hypothetical protein
MQTAGWDPVRGQWVLVPHGFQRSARPTYRESHPVGAGGVWAGIGFTTAWFMFFAMVTGNARSYAWSTIIAGVLAFGAAAALARYGDRGVAVGVAGTAAVAVSIAGVLVGVRYLGGDWILW